ncbi:malto-oligosyltrehalose synthase [Pedobacter chinensis]|uniref:4-alpha-glucanotransferase n=1 Tax=Pedobacter chinensis TaxID=2282421 RepID=A0A369Q072_9SPHI|nr:malto-oligosyltrehalose synthase [Pedobacter chinensis]RDC58144.1 malto-oligosyltrehalose synthase [Pedobacter chinensis]
MFKPTSTYRIQFHKDFNFKSLDKILPYLKKLGIDTIYASPIFEAVNGSTHGYDIVNPHRINPEIGTEKELLAISKKLKAAGINWLQDIVPNHMAFHQENKWLMDVLEKGVESSFASFFDIDISNHQQLMVPFLGDDLTEVIDQSELKIVQINKKHYLSYGGANWPLRLSSEKKLKRKSLKEINDKTIIKEIANEQFYRLCNWQETNSTINYRRFFTVNSLICLNIQDDENFNLYHEYILELVQKGVFQGIRIDHIDGLYDPKQYLDRLRKAAGDDIYIVVEKILELNEQMPDDWNAQGNTGYDFLAMMNNLFTNQSTKRNFDHIYKKITGKDLDPQMLIKEKKTAILFDHMQGELNNLLEWFISLNLAPKDEIEAIGKEQLKTGIGEMLIQMPVYRYYNYDFPLAQDDHVKLKTLLSGINKNKVAEFLKKIFLEKPKRGNKLYNQKLTRFYQRLMQFTGPLMAKGVEDTVMFTYNRFVGHTEVGDAPDAFGLSVAEFHAKMINRQLHWPLSLNGSSTHDTKKGEDVRARLNVLTDLPNEWAQVVNNFIAVVEKLKKDNNTFSDVHKNDSYLILQTILGALPMPGEEEDNLPGRLQLYIEKALREAKKRSDWAEPNDDYERLVKEFAANLWSERGENFSIITEFLNRIADFGIINSLAQLVLKFTCPGIPDIYQGTELWDLSLVDPDNRRPVDYPKRKKFLADTQSVEVLWNERYSGKIKLWLTRQLINFRKQNADVFISGDYIPLEIKGVYASNVFAFARKHHDHWIFIVVPLGMAAIAGNEKVNKFDWLDTQVILPEKAPTTWSNVISGKNDVKDFLNAGILLNQIFDEIPIGILESKTRENQRSAGILMHITSLPSNYGIGDFGSEAMQFIDFLKETNQSYWQLLPLNPTKAENGHSPYSSNSAKAGNVFLIAPDGLVTRDLLTEKDLVLAKLPVDDRIDFQKVEKLKGNLLKKAYKNFIKSKDSGLLNEYYQFCEQERNWLDNYAIYCAIKKNHQHLEWYKWPREFKIKDHKTILSFAEKHFSEIDEFKWQQFVFFKQWVQLKEYANQNGIKIIGDLPFYLDYDSVEVWSQPELFKLDKDLKPTQIAGVPPDYFSEKGQLWGMPVFNWQEMKRNRYDWWIKRLKKNMEMFDLLRLDHFRAFSSYWAVPAENDDAINGTWQKSVGADFFKTIQSEWPELPFIAEDLGEITEDVEILRDRFKLPGMKVLQFSFGTDLVSSPHIPHNFNTKNCMVYTGTHDNNTLKGWFTQEIDDLTKQRINKYIGSEVNKDNIHQKMIRLAYSSSAEIAIMPIQDVLGLYGETRMNTPGNAQGNWLWRLNTAMLPPVKKWLSEMVEVYGRMK